jgi:GT2 family glycosyltransferase
LHPEFITEAVAACQRDPALAAVQGKIYQYSLSKLPATSYQLPATLIDTCGFALTKGRRVVNIGHGEPDTFRKAEDVFGVEGAVPFFRRSALERCHVEGHIWDSDYFWYGDDLDLAWRMTLFGHRQRFVPSAIAWHDRSTTKGAARTPVIGQLTRLKHRRAIPLAKRRLDWLNTRLTLVKNDHASNLLRHAPFILAREIAVLGYMMLFEPAVLTATWRFVTKLPQTLHIRRAVMARATATAATMRQWIR